MKNKPQQQHENENRIGKYENTNKILLTRKLRQKNYFIFMYV